jgi:hypothetical protein
MNWRRFESPVYMNEASNEVMCAMLRVHNWNAKGAIQTHINSIAKKLKYLWSLKDK